MYHVSALCISKSISELPLSLVQPFVYMSVIYWVANLSSVHAYLWSLLVLTFDVYAAQVGLLCFSRKILNTKKFLREKAKDKYQDILVSYRCFSFAPELVGYSAPRDLHRRAAYSICESWVFIHQDVYLDLYVCS